jgi:hypothetical protein
MQRFETACCQYHRHYLLLFLAAADPRCFMKALLNPIVHRFVFGQFRRDARPQGRQDAREGIGRVQSWTGGGQGVWSVTKKLWLTIYCSAAHVLQLRLTPLVPTFPCRPTSHTFAPATVTATAHVPLTCFACLCASSVMLPLPTPSCNVLSGIASLTLPLAVLVSWFANGVIGVTGWQASNFTRSKGVHGTARTVNDGRQASTLQTKRSAFHIPLPPPRPPPHPHPIHPLPRLLSYRVSHRPQLRGAAQMKYTFVSFPLRNYDSDAS